MKLSTAAVLAAAAAPALAQNSTNGTASAAYLQQVLGALTAANLTSLVSAASAIANTSEGMTFLSQLASGNKTVFAPSNAAFEAVDSSALTNTTLVTEILSYHILNNTYTANGTNVTPNHTIARTLLRGGEYALPGNFSQPLVLTRNSTNATSFEIVQATSNVSTTGPAVAANLHVFIIDELLSLPATLDAAVGEFAPTLAGLLNQTQLAAPLEEIRGITVFAPNDGAIAAVMSTLGQLNSTEVANVLANHVINGSVVYSPGLSRANYTSAGGEPFTFVRNGSMVQVRSGNATANIIQSDIILANGVLHIIDGVLANPASNSSAAAAAESSYASVIATSTEGTAPVTATSATSPSGSTSPSSAASARVDLGLGKFAVGGIVGVLGLLVGGGFALM